MIFFHQTQGKTHFENRFQGVQISKFSSMDVVIYNKIKAYLFNKGILCEISSHQGTEEE